MVEMYLYILFNFFIGFIKSINIFVNFIINNKINVGYINDIY